MSRNTQFAIMFFVACSLTGIAINGPKIYGWVLSMDACSALLSVGVILFGVAFVGRRELKNEKEIERRIHEEREERVKWILQDNIEKRKKELMQKQTGGVE